MPSASYKYSSRAADWTIKGLLGVQFSNYGLIKMSWTSKKAKAIKFVKDLGCLIGNMQHLTLLYSALLIFALCCDLTTYTG